MDIGLRKIHIGKAIEKRRSFLKMNKSELGRRIGVSQQHVNRILERDTMETAKLVKICEVLDYNFFALYCVKTPKDYTQQNINSPHSALSIEGDAYVYALDEQHLQEQVANLTEQNKALAQENERLRTENSKVTELQGTIKNLEDKVADKCKFIEGCETQLEWLHNNMKFQVENYEMRIKLLSEQLDMAKAKLAEIDNYNTLTNMEGEPMTD